MPLTIRKCREEGCGADIVFIKMPGTEQYQPFDAKAIVVLTEPGALIPGRHPTSILVRGRQPHIATCYARRSPSLVELEELKTAYRA